jgi:hypothetical protein
MRGTIFCPFFVFINMDFQKIIDDFNDGEFDAELFFGDWNTFFTVLDKRGLISQIDLENTEVQNSLLIWLYGRDRKRFHEFVVDKLSDVDMDENGVIYLDPKNMKHLREYVVENLKGQKIETETIELSDIAREQGHPEYVTVDNPMTAQTIIDDKESMNHLLDTYLEDLKSDLESIHRNAYNQAYESETYENIFSELQEYINGNGEFYSRPHRFKKDTVTQRFRVPVASNFDEIILDYLISNKNRGSRGLLEYWGDYMPIVQDEQDCLTVHPPEYADYRQVEENINEIFTDYI